MSQPTSSPPRHDDAPQLAQCRAALFDLDGTLADTAPDLVTAVNKMRRDRGLALVPVDELRHLASAGARGLLGGAFGIGPEHRDFAPMREEFLANYEADLCIETTLFPGIAELLDALDERRIRWGIVTNKVGRLTMPLVAQLGLATRAGCVVSGDTTPQDETTPETYFSIKRVVNYAGEPRYAAGQQDFTLADDQRQDTFSLGGTWDVDFQGATAVSDDARVRLAYDECERIVVRFRGAAHPSAQNRRPRFMVRLIQRVCLWSHLKDHRVQVHLHRAIEHCDQLGLLLPGAETGARRPIHVVHRRYPHATEFSADRRWNAVRPPSRWLRD